MAFAKKIATTKFDSLYLDLNEHGGVWVKMQSSMFIVRRILTGFVLVFLTELPNMQILMLIFLSLMSLVYLVITLPYNSKFQNIIEIFNEGILLLATYCMLIFTD